MGVTHVQRMENRPQSAQKLVQMENTDYRQQ